MSLECAFFDVDGTVIARDSFRFLILRLIKQQPWRLPLFIVAIPFFLVSLLLGDRRWPKSVWLWCATVGLSKRQAVRKIRACFHEQWKRLWFVEATPLLARLRSENKTIVYVSASGQMWVRDLLKTMDKSGQKIVIASHIGWWLGGLVWKSPNCFGEEKLRRIHARINENIEWAEGYSDSWADIPMLAKCNKKFAVNANKKSLIRFENKFKNNFTILKWNSDI